MTRFSEPRLWKWGAPPEGDVNIESEKASGVVFYRTAIFCRTELSLFAYSGIEISPLTPCWNDNSFMLESDSSSGVVRTATSMKMAVFFVVALCSLVGTDRRFEDNYCLVHQGDR
jgi:hypothetical protein